MLHGASYLAGTAIVTIDHAPGHAASQNDPGVSAPALVVQQVSLAGGPSIATSGCNGTALMRPPDSQRDSP